MKIKKNEKIEIEWVDILTESAWIDEEKALMFQTAKCRTMGYFLNQDKKTFRLSDTLGKDKDRSITAFPQGVITKIRRLK